MKQQELTERQAEFLRRLIAFWRDREMLPTTREMQEFVGLKSPRSVGQYLEALEKAGYIERAGGKRQIRILQPPPGFGDGSIPRMHGRAILAMDVEFAVSGPRFSDDRFSSLCNSVVLAVTRRAGSIPSFTERIKVSDKGIDAHVTLPDDTQALPPFIKPGWTVFQYKRRSVYSRNRNQIVSELKRELKGAVQDLLKKTGQAPSQYILFANLDFSHKEKTALQQSILHGFKGAPAAVVIVGAAELATFLNDLPHLRAAFFSEERFCTWFVYYEQRVAARLRGKDVRFVGRGDELRTIAEALLEPKLRMVIVAGPPDIGKTRLIAEATKRAKECVVFALDPSIPASEFISLETGDRNITCVLEEPEPKAIPSLLEQALSGHGPRVLLAVRSIDDATTYGYANHPSLRILPVGPLTESEAFGLLQEAAPNLDFSLASWIVQQANGNPGVILEAAKLGRQLRIDPETFLAQVGRGLEGRVREEFGASALEVLRALSLLTFVGITGDASDELEAISAFMGPTFSPNTALMEVPKLASAGLIEKRGSYVSVQPPILARKLAEDALLARSADLATLFSTLKAEGRRRLIRRIGMLHGQEVERFWDLVIGSAGPLRNLASALGAGELLQAAAGSAPKEVASLIHRDLAIMTRDERAGIRDEKRRNLLWALDELLLQKESSVTAMRCMALLAEAETESWANNATGVFAEAFHPLHPQVAASLPERLEVLKEVLGEGTSIELRLVGIRAAAAALHEGGGEMLRPSRGPIPHAEPQRLRMTWGDVWEFQEQAVQLLMSQSASADNAVAKAACDVLPECLKHYATGGRPKEAMRWIDRLVDRALDGDVRLSPASLVDQLQWLKRFRPAEIRDVSEEVDSLLRKIDAGDFVIQLRRWASEWTLEDHPADNASLADAVAAQGLRQLAEEAASKPEHLSPPVLDWLCSGEARKAHLFFGLLGVADTEAKLLDPISALGEKPEGESAFATYMSGLADHKPVLVRKMLDTFAGTDRVRPMAILRATAYLDPESSDVDRLLWMLAERKADSFEAGWLIASGSRWPSKLSSQDAVRCVRAITGDGVKNADAGIEFLGYWRYHKKPIEEEMEALAWECLKRASDERNMVSYHADELGAALTKNSPEKGFETFQSLMSRLEKREGWCPINSEHTRKFWDELRKVDAERAVRTVVATAKNGHMARISIDWKMAKIIDQEADREALWSVAASDEAAALLIAGWVNGSRPGFFPIASRILEKYPENKRIRDALTGGLFGRNQVFAGSYSGLLNSYANSVREALESTEWPARTRAWLEDVLSGLAESAKRTRHSEQDAEANE